MTFKLQLLIKYVKTIGMEPFTKTEDVDYSITTCNKIRLESLSYEQLVPEQKY